MHTYNSKLNIIQLDEFEFRNLNVTYLIQIVKNNNNLIQVFSILIMKCIIEHFLQYYN